MKYLFTSATLATVFFVAGAQAQVTYVGNYGSVSGLSNVTADGGGNADGDPPLVILGEYGAAGPLATAPSQLTLPSGTVQDVSFYANGNYDFTLYALSLATTPSSPNEQAFTVVASETFIGTANSQGIVTLSVLPGFNVSAGDLLAFAGIGPWYAQANDGNGADIPPGNDATYTDSDNAGGYTATPPLGTAGTTFTVGTNGDENADYNYIPANNPGRTYAIGVCVSSVPEPSTFISGALLLLPFAGGALRLARKKFGK